jgi:hypothetical protein
VYSAFRAVYTDATDSTKVYTYIIPGSNDTLTPTIPSGIYDITISKIKNVTSYYFSPGCSLSATGISAKFSNVNVSVGNCTTITIDTIGPE